MNSCLYKAHVMHNRLAPKVHRFHYDVFMFYLDLDEIDTLHKQLKFMSRNRFNLFNFRDRDHLQLPREKPDTSKILNSISRITCLPMVLILAIQVITSPDSRFEKP